MNAKTSTLNDDLPRIGQNIRLKGNLYCIDSELYDGPFSKVFIISDTNQQFAMKLEWTTGPSRFTLPTCLRIALQTVDRIRSLHDSGWLCRDIKANNFCIGRSDSGIIYMLDFGFARRYKRNDGNIIEKRTAAGLMGTIYYAPRAAHRFSDQCRRDDLESWFYMLIEITTGMLPWLRCDPKAQYMLIGEWKQFAREAGRYALLEGCPQEYDLILKLIDQTGYYARPDYNGIAIHLKRAANRLKIDLLKPFDWQLNNRLIQKSMFVGERGESDIASEKMKECLRRVNVKEDETTMQQQNNNDSKMELDECGDIDMPI